MSKEDRVAVPDVRLEIDPSRKVPPKKARTPADIPIFLRKAVDEEFHNMIEAGILEKVKHPTQWCSTLFFL